MWNKSVSTSSCIRRSTDTICVIEVHTVNRLQTKRPAQKPCNMLAFFNDWRLICLDHWLVFLCFDSARILRLNFKRNRLMCNNKMDNIIFFFSFVSITQVKSRTYVWCAAKVSAHRAHWTHIDAFIPVKSHTNAKSAANDSPPAQTSTIIVWHILRWVTTYLGYGLGLQWSMLLLVYNTDVTIVRCTDAQLYEEIFEHDEYISVRKTFDFFCCWLLLSSLLRENRSSNTIAFSLLTLVDMLISVYLCTGALHSKRLQHMLHASAINTFRSHAPWLRLWATPIIIIKWINSE